MIVTGLPDNLATNELHILLVEDREDSREVYQKLFRMAGFTPIIADSVRSALGHLHATPQLALVVTDMDLGSGDEWGGRDLLARIRVMNRHIPVIAYSAHYDASSISSATSGSDATSDDPQFDRIFPKVSSEAQFDEIVSICRSLAQGYLDQRRAIAKRAIEKFEAMHPGTEITVSKLREFLPRSRTIAALSSDDKTMDEILSHEGYRLIVIQAGYRVPEDVGIKSQATASPVAIWVRQEQPELFIAELYGDSSLYSEATTESDVIESLLVLMLGFHLDFKEHRDVQDHPMAASLRDFLASAFEERS